MFSKMLTESDYFGHKADLNYSQQRSKHSTILGISVTLIIRIFMIGYVLFLVKKLVLKEGNINNMTPF